MKQKNLHKIMTLFLTAILLLGSSLQVLADEKHSGVASEKDMAAPREVVSYGMLPIYGRDVVDGSYDIQVDSSSNFFHISKAKLTAKRGELTAVLQMNTTSYEFVYPGSRQDAAAAPLSDYIRLDKNSGGGVSFHYKVEALDKGLPCAAYSKKKHMWYDRTILFQAGSLPKEALKVEVPDYHRIEWAMQELDKKQKEEGKTDESGDSSVSSQPVEEEGVGEAYETTGPMEIEMKDGEYSIEVNMTGGSGRASISSPTLFIVKNGEAYARLLWSSTYYDYMIVGGKKYKNETKDGGNSTFTIPISQMDIPIPVIADTTAMGDPVEIEYKLTFYKDTIGEKGLIPQEAAKKVLMIAAVVIIVGAILNHLVKTRRKGR